MPNAPAKGVTSKGRILQCSDQAGLGLSTPKTKTEISRKPMTAPINILWIKVLISI